MNNWSVTINPKIACEKLSIKSQLFKVWNSTGISYTLTLCPMIIVFLFFDKKLIKSSRPFFTFTGITSLLWQNILFPSTLMPVISCAFGVTGFFGRIYVLNTSFSPLAEICVMCESLAKMKKRQHWYTLYKMLFKQEIYGQYKLSKKIMLPIPLYSNCSGANCTRYIGQDNNKPVQMCP